MVQKQNLLEFIMILKSFEIEDNKFDILSKIHSEIESLDVDLLIEYIKKSNAEVQLKEKLVSLINMYYNLIDDQINNYKDNKAEEYLLQLKESALIIFKKYHENLAKLCDKA